MAGTAQETLPATETSSATTAAGLPVEAINAEELSSKDNTISEKNFTEFLKGYNSAYRTNQAKDEIGGKYRIDLNQPLPEFSSQLATAYVATDIDGTGAEYYGLVLPMDIPYRYKTISALINIQHPNIISCVSEGIIALSNSGNMRKAMIFEKPKGSSLSQILREHKKPLPESFLLKHILTPLNEILKALQKHGINHGQINLNNIYVDGNNVTLGECVSGPSGYSQNFMFEPLERAMAAPAGKGSADMSGDCYALGVLACMLAIGKDISTEMSAQAHLENVLQYGSYAVLTKGRDISDNLQDILRGALNDNKQERWTPDHIAKWLGGKRYNLIPPSSPKEASRPIVFAEQDYFSRSALAHALYTHAESAYQILEDSKIVRWAELSLHKKEVADHLDNIVNSAYGEKPHSSRMKFLIARTIITLDPSGPVRTGAITANIDGIGSVLADAWRNNSQQIIQDVSKLIENDLPTYWSDLQTIPENATTTAVLWQMQKIRQYARHKSLGFGVERILYDLNSSLPCQSKLLESYHVSSIRELLETLDEISKEKHAANAPIDRHIAAFLTSKMDLAKEVRIPELNFDRELSNNPKLTGLKLLALAQEKSGSPSLPGLAHWVALHVFSVLDYIHNRETRQTVIKEIMNAAKRGKLAQIVYILFNAKVYLSDQEEFAKAIRLFKFNQHKIAHFQDTKILSARARQAGHKGALLIGYTILFITLYGVMQEYLNL